MVNNDLTDRIEKSGLHNKDSLLIRYRDLLEELLPKKTVLQRLETYFKLYVLYSELHISILPSDVFYRYKTNLYCKVNTLIQRYNSNNLVTDVNVLVWDGEDLIIERERYRYKRLIWCYSSVGLCKLVDVNSLLNPDKYKGKIYMITDSNPVTDDVIKLFKTCAEYYLTGYKAGLSQVSERLEKQMDRCNKMLGRLEGGYVK